jgi:hypothetical protein
MAPSLLFPTQFLVAKLPPIVLSRVLTTKSFLYILVDAQGLRTGKSALKPTILVDRSPTFPETCPYMVQHVRKQFYREMQLLNG